MASLGRLSANFFADLSRNLMMRVCSPKLIFDHNRHGIDLEEMSVLELISELASRGWSKAEVTTSIRSIPPYEVGAGPFVWYSKKNTSPFREYLLSLLTAADNELPRVFHLQAKAYYKCLELEPRVIPHQPAQFYRAMMGRKKRNQNTENLQSATVPEQHGDDEDAMNLDMVVSGDLQAAATAVKQKPVKPQQVKRQTLVKHRLSGQRGAHEAHDIEICDSSSNGGQESECEDSEDKDDSVFGDEPFTDSSQELDFTDGNVSLDLEQRRPDQNNDVVDVGGVDGECDAQTQPSGSLVGALASVEPVVELIASDSDNDRPGATSREENSAASAMAVATRPEHRDPSSDKDHVVREQPDWAPVVAPPKVPAVPAAPNLQDAFTPRINSEGHRRVCAFLLPEP